MFRRYSSPCTCTKAFAPSFTPEIPGQRDDRKQLAGIAWRRAGSRTMWLRGLRWFHPGSFGWDRRAYLSSPCRLTSLKRRSTWLSKDHEYCIQDTLEVLPLGPRSTTAAQRKMIQIETKSCRDSQAWTIHFGTGTAELLQEDSSEILPRLDGALLVNFSHSSSALRIRSPLQTSRRPKRNHGP